MLEKRNKRNENECLTLVNQNVVSILITFRSLVGSCLTGIINAPMVTQSSLLWNEYIELFPQQLNSLLVSPLSQCMLPSSTTSTIQYFPCPNVQNDNTMTSSRLSQQKHSHTD